MQKQLVYVGSTSEHKLRAVREALDELSISAEVIAESSASQVNEQPLGIEETFRGAMNRALGISNNMSDRVWIGIENGIVPLCEATHAYVDIAAVVLITEPVMSRRDPESIKCFVSTSAGPMINPEDLVIAKFRGLHKCTASTVTRERTGCDATDATPHYTGGRMTRTELLKQAVKLVLCQWLAAKEGAK